MLSTVNLRIRKHPSPDGKMRPKLAPRYIGPFRVRAKHGQQVYQLWLPPYYDIHDTFHVSLLKPYYYRKGESPPDTTTEPADVLADGKEI